MFVQSTPNRRCSFFFFWTAFPRKTFLAAAPAFTACEILAFGGLATFAVAVFFSKVFLGASFFASSFFAGAAGLGASFAIKGQVLIEIYYKT